MKPDALTSVIRLNGVEQSRFATNSMIFGVANTLATMTRYLTLVPGDTVEVEITRLGVLRNPIVAEA